MIGLRSGSFTIIFYLISSVNAIDLSLSFLYKCFKHLINSSFESILFRGVAAVKFLVGQKKIAKGSIFFPIWAKNNFELGKKRYLEGQTPKLIHSRYAPVFIFNKS